MSQKVSSKSLKSDLLRQLNRTSDRVVATFQNHITDILKYNSKKWIDVVDPKVKQKTIDILLLTKNLKPEISLDIDSIINDGLNKITFVFDENGKWLEINKLNTNRSDLPIFIVDIVSLFPEFDISVIINEIVNKDSPRHPNFSTLALCLNKAVNNPKFIWDNLLCNPEKYIQHIRKYSKQGEKVENSIRDEYVKNGWEIVYQGGDGNLIDMLLGVDLIVKKNEKYLYLQIKKITAIHNVEIDNQMYTEVKGDTYIKNFKYIDAVIYCTENGEKVGVKNQIYYIKKMGKLITEKGIPCPTRANEKSIYLKK